MAISKGNATMEKNRRRLEISINTANNLIWILVLSHVLINAAIIVLYSFDGISNKEELYHIIGHLIGLAGGVWLCVFIAKENSCKFNSDKHEEKLEESEED